MRMDLHETSAPQRPDISTLPDNPVDKAWADIAQACKVHERFLAEYGSLSDAVLTRIDQ